MTKTLVDPVIIMPRTLELLAAFLYQVGHARNHKIRWGDGLVAEMQLATPFSE
jgi:hypothetical protein